MQKGLFHQKLCFAYPDFKHKIDYLGTKLDFITYKSKVDNSDPIFSENFAFFLEKTILEKKTNNSIFSTIMAKQFSLTYLITSFSKRNIELYLERKKEKNQEIYEAYKAYVDSFSGIDNIEEQFNHLSRIAFLEEKIQLLNENKKAFADSLIYSMPLDILLRSWSDDRTINNQEFVNKYGSTTKPNPKKVCLSSCTISEPFLDAYKIVDELRHKLLIAAKNYELESTLNSEFEKIKQKIFDLFSIDRAKNELVFTPSGTDAEIIPSLIALFSSDYNKVCNVVVAEGEVGSGTKFAAGLKHFSKKTPFGPDVIEGEEISEISKNIEVKEISARSDNGDILKEKIVENKILKLILENKNSSSIILHFVHCSKSGIRTPSLDFLTKLKCENNDLTIVADLAQMRVDQEEINEFLDRGFIVLISGSKYFAGPPFSGGVFVPKKLIPEEERIPELNEFKSYFSNKGLDPNSVFVNIFNEKTNPGLLLRWYSAVYEMEKYYSVDESIREKTAKVYMNQLFKKLSKIENIQIVDDEVDSFSLNKTILSFSFFNQGNFLSKDELKKIHMLLRKDITSYLPNNISAQDKEIASKICLIGQPIKITKSKGALRIALSAPRCAELALKFNNENNFEAIVNELIKKEFFCISKLDLISKYYDVIKSNF